MLLYRGFLIYATGSSAVLGGRYTENVATIRYSEVFGLGLIGLFNYLLQPTSWLLMYCFAEGVIRSVEASISERNRGVTAAYLLYKVAALAGFAYSAEKKKLLFGPPRPDEIRAFGDPERAGLEIYSVDEKPWHDRQVVRYRNELFLLLSRDVIPTGPYQSHHYRFRKLGPSEIIRGRIVDVG